MEVAEVKSVGLGNGQVFWYDTRQELESAIARLHAEQLVLARQDAEPMMDAMRRLAEQSEPGVIDWARSWVALATANPGKQERYITNLTGRVWGAMLRVQDKQRVPFGIYCSECGDYSQSTDLSNTRMGIHGVRHAKSCDVARVHHKLYFKVEYRSLLENQGVFERRDFVGVGPAIRLGFRALLLADH